MGKQILLVCMTVLAAVACEQAPPPASPSPPAQQVPDSAPQGGMPDAGGMSPVNTPDSGGAAAPGGGRAILELEPFKDDKFSLAKPSGWPLRGQRVEDPFHVLRFSPPEGSTGGVFLLEIAAAVLQIPGVGRSKEFIQGVVDKQGWKVLGSSDCCSDGGLYLAHWAMVTVDTGVADQRVRFATVLATANHVFEDRAPVVQSVITLYAPSVEQLKAVNAETVLLNVAQSVAPPNPLTSSALPGVWVSGGAGGVDFVNSSGAYVGGNTLGEYQRFTFSQGDQYELVTVISASGVGSVNKAVLITETGRFRFDAGVLAFSRSACRGNVYNGSVHDYEFGCADHETPLALRIEPRSGGRLQVSGVSLVATHQHKPSFPTAVRK
jgi:hypothetical protein